MTTVIAVPGAWYGSWCWEDVAPLIAAAGHKLVALDLPGTGADTPPAGSPTLAHWVHHVAARIEAEPAPVVLVGHSRGGLIISAVAERIPGRIARLVYLCALLLRDGESPERYFADFARDAGDVFVLCADGRLVLRPEAARRLLFNTTDADAAERALARLGAEPAGIVGTQVRLSPDRYDGVPRAYIRCGADRAIRPAVQAAMLAASPCDPVLDLACDHSPFLSVPDVLARLLVTLAEPGLLP